MSQPILVPLDGSRLSEAVLPVVQAFRRHAPTEILLLRSVGPDESSGPESQVRQRMDAYLSGVAETLKAHGQPDVRWTVWYGDPAQVIVNAATRAEATLIAMGTHGRAGLNRLRFGSVAETVVRQAPVPVLLVRGEFPPGLDRMTRVLVPLDGSERSRAILAVVERLAVRLQVALTLLHVIELPPLTGLAAETPLALPLEIGARQRAEAEAYLAETAARLATKGLRASVAVREGEPVDVICRLAEEAGYGLIAMSTHGRSGVGRLVLGSIAERVLRATSVPVLLWKAPIDGHPSAVRTH